jgi:hypothetical protein
MRTLLGALVIAVGLAGCSSEAGACGMYCDRAAEVCGSDAEDVERCIESCDARAQSAAERDCLTEWHAWNDCETRTIDCDATTDECADERNAALSCR